ncbi:NAD-dependent epimerase/dehydratase family protein [Thermogladius sp. 4427co]|uniref:NAD-dependent epimerase/dehydratase family protein n=1 Tax=Thermogladius sp. 4427co TaxID=3450718 RepID=UPI003F7AC39A
MKILVTGGAGFIGHNLALFLGEKGFDVVVFDSFERLLGSLSGGWRLLGYLLSGGCEVFQQMPGFRRSSPRSSLC